MQKTKTPKRILSEEGVLALLREMVRAAGSQKKFAIRHGISEQYVSDVLKRRREPGGKILEALGLKKIICYELL